MLKRTIQIDIYHRTNIERIRWLWYSFMIGSINLFAYLLAIDEKYFLV